MIYCFGSGGPLLAYYLFYRPRSEGDNVIGSVRPFVCHYRSEGFVCLSVISRACADNRADAVDRLLIFCKTWASQVLQTTA